MRQPALLSLSLIAVLASLTAPAHAYCRSRSCDFTSEDGVSTCAKDPTTDCTLEGEFTYWPDPCLTYAVQSDGSPRLGLDADEIQAMLAEAFETWRSASCPGGGQPNFEAVFQGYVGCNQRESVCADASDNVHTVIFQEGEWTADEKNAAGLTTPRGSVKSGFLIDADVEFNTSFFETNGTAESPLDLKRVMAHEIGHFLGLDHSRASGALMSTYYHQISTEETLTVDDIEGICAIYPPAATPLACSPSSPAYDACSSAAIAPGEACSLPASAGDPPAEPGCSFDRAPLGAAPRSSALVASGALGLFVLARRARRAPRRLVR